MTAKRKRHRRDKNIGIDGLKRQLQASGLFKEREIVTQPSEGAKLSAVLLDFIEPYKKAARTTEAYRKLITLAVVAWNAALLTGAERQELIDITIKAIVTSAGEEWRKDAENIIAMLMRRKEQHFADDKRFIVDYRVTETEREYHLAVASVVKS